MTRMIFRVGLFARVGFFSLGFFSLALAAFGQSTAAPAGMKEKTISVMCGIARSSLTSRDTAWDVRYGFGLQHTGPNECPEVGNRATDAVDQLPHAGFA